MFHTIEIYFELNPHAPQIWYLMQKYIIEHAFKKPTYIKEFKCGFYAEHFNVNHATFRLFVSVFGSKL